MNSTQKLMAAILGVFVVGFLMVGGNKTKTNEQREAESMIRAVAALQEMANQKCPAKIKELTGSQVYFPSNTDTDKATYVTLEWVGEKDDKFKTASCTLTGSLGGISRLVIDGRVVINKDV